MEDVEVFELKCMDIIEVITSIDETNTRQDAILIAKKMRDKAIEKESKDVLMYERVVHELEIATDAEFELLKKQIFK